MKPIYKILKGHHPNNNVYCSGLNNDQIGSIIYDYIGDDYNSCVYLNDDYSKFDAS